MIYASLCRMYSPDLNAPTLQADPPISYVDKKMIINPSALKKWDSNFVINMVGRYTRELMSLTSLKIDWGRNDQFPHIPLTNIELSRKLEALGIPHFAEEYIGDHTNMLDGFHGRVFTDVLPFFERYLK